MLKSMLKREFGTTNYINEVHDGDGQSWITLDNYPVTKVKRCTTGRRDALQISNSSTDASNATAEVTTTAIRLIVEGGANAHDWKDFLFATSTTMTTIAAAINAYGKGWTCTAETDYAGFASSDLLERRGAGCLGGATLYIPEEGVESLQVYSDGRVYRRGGVFVSGTANVYVSYTAGYATADMPQDLRLAALTLMKSIYDSHNENADGLKAYSLGDISKTFGGLVEQGSWMKSVLSMYKKRMI
jgi:hypothetical protein